jgi:hypothetical protein
MNRCCGRGLQDNDPVVLRRWWVWKPDRSHCPCAWMVYVVWIAVTLNLFSYLIFIPYSLADCHCSVASVFYGLIPIICTFVIKIARGPTVCVAFASFVWSFCFNSSLIVCFHWFAVFVMLHHYSISTLLSRDTRWRSWLRHCATSRKVACSIPDGVTGIFHWHNPSGRTMAVGLTQPLTEMSTRNISWGVKAAGA